MNPGELRPLGIGETLDAALKLTRAQYGRLVSRAAMVLVPLYLLGWILGLSVASDIVVSRGGTAEMLGGSTGASVPWVFTYAWMVLGVVGTFAVMTAGVRVAVCGYLDDPTGAVLPPRGGSVGTALVALLATLGGALLCLVGASYPFTVFAVALPAAVVEGARTGGALGRSFRLVHKRFWATLGTMLAAWFLLWIAAQYLSVPFTGFLIAGELEDPYTYVTVHALTEVVTDALVLPLWPALVAVVYFDLRIRKEGFDLALTLHSGGDGGGGLAAADRAAASGSG